MIVTDDVAGQSQFHSGSIFYKCVPLTLLGMNDIESGAGGLTREVETPLPSNSPHDPMMLRVDLVGSHGRWKRPCLQTAHMTL
jgi:hypothetical protein